MKRTTLLFILTFITAGCVYAQERLAVPHIDYSSAGNNVFNAHVAGPAYKITTGADTVVYTNSSAQISAATTYKYYVDNASTLDSGYYLGINAYGYKGWAEAYNITVPTDSAMTVIGTISVWHGNYKLTTNKTLSIEVWNTDTAHGTILNPSAYLTGFPQNVLTSEMVPIRSLKMGYNNAPDTLSAITWFHTPANVTGYFFVGYEMTYDFHNLNGDTICIRATQQGTGSGHKNFYYMDNMGDTVYHVRNAIELASGTWLDPYWQAHLNVNYSIVPIVQIRDITGVSNISKNGLSFYGAYPNPAVNNATIRFSLEHTDDVLVQVIDMQGRILSVVKEAHLSAGMHEITVNTTAMSPGNYIYSVSNSTGAAFAAELTIIK